MSLELQGTYSITLGIIMNSGMGSIENQLNRIANILSVSIRELCSFVYPFKIANQGFDLICRYQKCDVY